MLSDGTIVAIKKLNKVNENQVEQFINEIVILSQINHRNVVRLFGCCLATESPQLVYEFLPNGTLFDFIHEPKIEFPPTWSMRMKIATDVAGALAYIHSSSSIPIYHRDIKSDNILLDEKYVVKVVDFGLSKLVQVDQTHLTTMVKGTWGYIAPEYAITGRYTEKSDVYSFGVVLLELLTGKRTICNERDERHLVPHFLVHMEADNLDAILDAHVYVEAAKEEVLAFGRIARRCVNAGQKFRPTMKEVASELERLKISVTNAVVCSDGEDELSCSDGDGEDEVVELNNRHRIIEPIQIEISRDDSSFGVFRFLELDGNEGNSD
ncbi:wall-associated receptor kinase-like 1 [Salvia miltiorrhiza]|uniref:wall-associated receptor kinase-like 1 n=1 Tax=Salvia miltiorrhiza TaxID=226208 RepID=UPI0025AD617B|nr:wall-associated receptor kinase-like 1 [Salvia miltiorrhiza]